MTEKEKYLKEIEELQQTAQADEKDSQTKTQEDKKIPPNA